jgi:hypothetical protein
MISEQKQQMWEEIQNIPPESERTLEVAVFMKKWKITNFNVFLLWLYEAHSFLTFPRSYNIWEAKITRPNCTIYYRSDAINSQDEWSKIWKERENNE